MISLDVPWPGLLKFFPRTLNLWVQRSQKIAEEVKERIRGKATVVEFGISNLLANLAKDEKISGIGLDPSFERVELARRVLGKSPNLRFGWIEPSSAEVFLDNQYYLSLDELLNELPRTRVSVFKTDQVPYRSLVQGVLSSDIDSHIFSSISPVTLKSPGERILKVIEDFTGEEINKMSSEELDRLLTKKVGFQKNILRLSDPWNRHGFNIIELIRSKT